MGLFRSGTVLGIAEEALTFARESARDAHPDEYMGLLRGRAAGAVGLEESGTVLTEVLFIPGTTTNPVSATVDTNMIPNDPGAAGSIHSHPNGVLRPSDADLATFGRNRTHIILGAPYGPDDWQAFDRTGDPVDLPVLDVDLDETDDLLADPEAEEEPADDDGGLLGLGGWL